MEELKLKSVNDLKVILRRAGVDYSDCFEKSDLIEKILSTNAHLVPEGLYRVFWPSRDSTDFTHAASRCDAFRFPVMFGIPAFFLASGSCWPNEGHLFRFRWILVLVKFPSVCNSGKAKSLHYPATWPPPTKTQTLNCQLNSEKQNSSFLVLVVTGLISLNLSCVHLLTSIRTLNKAQRSNWRVELLSNPKL